MNEASPERPDLYRPTDEDLQRIDRLGLLDYWDAAEVMCNDTDLRIFHRFSELRVFVILRLQHRLQAMAVSLDSLRQRQSRGEMEAIQNDSSLDILTKKIEATLKDYDAALLASARLDKLRTPSKKLLDNFINFCRTPLPKVVNDLGVNGPRWNPDAVTAIDLEEKSWTHSLIDQSEFLQRFFKVEKTMRKRRGIVVETYSESTIRRTEHVFVNVTFSLMLFCPIIALSFIENATAKLAIVLVFLLLGAVLTSGILTSANNAGLAVLAGYGAILVFFLGVKAGQSS